MEYQYQYNLYIGTTTKNNKKLNYKKAIKTTQNIINKFINCYTIKNSYGIWNSKKEKTILIDIIIDQKIDFIIDHIKLLLCNNLQQQCILSTKNIIKIEF